MILWFIRSVFYLSSSLHAAKAEKVASSSSLRPLSCSSSLSPRSSSSASISSSTCPVLLLLSEVVVTTVVAVVGSRLLLSMLVANSMWLEKSKEKEFLRFPALDLSFLFLPFDGSFGFFLEVDMG